MYLLKSPSGTYYTRLCLPKPLKVNGFPFDIKVSLLTKSRQTATYRNALVVAKLHPIVHCTRRDADLDGFTQHINAAIDEVRACFCGDSTTEERLQAPQRNRPTPIQAPTPIEAPSIKLVLQDFIASKTLESITKLSLSQLERRCLHFIDTMGVTSVQAVGSSLAQQYKDKLLAQGRSYKTNKEYLAAVKQFFSWCVGRELLSANPFGSVKLAKPTRHASEDRVRWSASQLNALFSHPLFLASETQLQIALRLILFHGARPSEICQLRMADVVLDAKVPYIDFNDKHSQQHLKNANATRLVPIHRAMLRDVQLKTWLESRRASHQTQLFDFRPLGPDNDWCKQLSSRFGKLQTQMGWTPNARPTLYGLRHTFIDELKQAQIAEHVVAQLVGHSYTHLTYGRYGKTLPLQALRKPMDAFNLCELK